MKKTIIFPAAFILMALFAACSLDETTGTGDSGSDIKLIINEYLASNDACCTDENGEFDDWFEIYNYGDTDVNIAGMYVSDSKSDYQKYQIPSTDAGKTTIRAKGFLVLWCDGQTDQGILHMPFKLSGSGEDITLTESNGITVIDELTYTAQTTDISMGRNPDGSDNWQAFSTPTPGASNTGEAPTFAPEISGITVSPSTITSSDAVTISATVTDKDGDLGDVTLTYGEAGAITNTQAMTADADTFSAQIGPFEDGKTVYFFITAFDGESKTAVSDTVSFNVGYVPPVLYINEYMASNDSSFADENGEYDDWIEIYNPGPDPVNIGGMYISDDLGDLTAWQIPDRTPDSTTIAAGGFIVLWADKETDQGILHVNLKLSSGGEDIVLTAPNGTVIIDSRTFGAQTTDVSEGRKPDGSNTWVNFSNPTPGASNNNAD